MISKSWYQVGGGGRGGQSAALPSNVVIANVCSVLLWMCTSVPVCAACTPTARVWKSEDNLRESILSFGQVEPRDGTWVIRLGDKHIYLLRELANLGTSQPAFSYKDTDPTLRGPPF